MFFNLNNKYDEAGDAGGGRVVALKIDTDVVRNKLAEMATVLDEQQQNMLKSFDLSGAWSSDHASELITKVAEINTSFTTISNIIKSLETKVNSYVTNVEAADNVSFNVGTEGEASGAATTTGTDQSNPM